MGRKVILAGPPQSGKSCLREGLKKALMKIEDAPYPYVITACPDGEGSWFQETVNRNPGLAKELKASYKGKFSDGFVQRIAQSVQNCPLELVLVDIGGIPSAENHRICASATDIVLLAGNKGDRLWSQRLAVWHVFAALLKLNVVAEIFSDYHGDRDTVEDQGKVLRGSVHYLERGEEVSERPMIRALAKKLAEMAR